jgi:hypothetical protein
MPCGAWVDYHKFYLAFGVPFTFGEADCHKIMGRETLSRSHDLNTTVCNVSLTESFSSPTKLQTAHTGI